MLVKESNDEDVPVKYTSLLNKVSQVGILYSINFPSANHVDVEPYFYMFP